MKYMGSKRAMLRNGLGELIHAEVSNFSRFVDLFAGSGAVAAHVARKYPIPVHAFDIQAYSVVVASALIERDYFLDSSCIWDSWLSTASALQAKMKAPDRTISSRSDVDWMRNWCHEQPYPITRAYGGYYFSASQALWFDAFRQTVPPTDEASRAAIASLIEAASQCVAAPGHTAQPFQPTPTALKFLKEAWNRDPISYVGKAFKEISQSRALAAGSATIGDANAAAKDLAADDLVFIDPPYSGVHYSRFYHVLETIAVGECGDVTGVGRYPEASRRPRSLYSLKGHSSNALNNLLESISQAGATAILTFPDHACSNGLSGEQVREMARRYFMIDDRYVQANFSTLGGHSQNRDVDRSRKARQSASEMMLLLKPH